MAADNPPARDINRTLELLQGLLQLGPRTPESAGEKETVRWLTNRLKQLGLEPQAFEFQYGKDSKRLALWALVAPWGLLACGLVAGFGPVLLLAAIVILLMALDFIWLPQWTGSSEEATGKNLIAGLTRPWDQIVSHPRRLILLSAHYDTAEGSRKNAFDLRNLRETLDSLALGGVAFLFGYLVIGSILWAIDWFYPSLALYDSAQWFWSTIGVWLFVALVGPLVFVLTWNVGTELANRPFMPNPGADDNSSGVACTLNLAHELTRTTSAREFDIAVAFWGAEELGLQGARSFLREHADTLPLDTTIVNIDSVGRGDTLLVVVGTGLFTKQPMSGELAKRAQAVAERHCADHWAPMWLSFLTGSTDQAAWLRAGYKSALSVSHGGVRKNVLVSAIYRLFHVPIDPLLPKWEHAHTPDDNIESINPIALDRTQVFVSRLIDELGEIN